MTVNNIRLTDSVYNLSQQIQSIENKLYPNADLSGYLGIKANLINKINKIALIPHLQKMIVQTERLSLKTQYAMEKSDPQSIKDLQSNLPILKKTKKTCEQVYHTCMTAKLSVLTQMYRDTQLDFSADPKTREKQHAMLIAIKNELILLSHNPYLNNQEKRIVKTLLGNVEELHPLVYEQIENSSMDLEPFVHEINDFSEVNKGQFSPCSEEILVHLLSFLPVKDLLRLARCSRFFKRICEDESIWENVRKRDLPFHSIFDQSAKKTCIRHKRFVSPINNFYNSLTLLNGRQEILCFEKDENLLFVGCIDGSIEVWDLIIGKQRTTLRAKLRNNNHIACLKKNGNLLFAGYNYAIEIFDLTDLKNIRCVTTLNYVANAAHQAPISCIHVENNQLFTGSDDGTVKIWDLSDLNNISSIKSFVFDHTSPAVSVQHLQLLHNSTLLVVGYKDNKIAMRDLSSGKGGAFDPSEIGKGNGCFTIKLPFIFLQLDNSIKVVDLKNMQCCGILKGHRDVVTCFEILGTALFSGSKDGTIKVWDLGNMQCIVTLEGHKDEIVSMDVRSGKLFSASRDGSVRRWSFGLENVFDHLLYKMPEGPLNIKNMIFMLQKIQNLSPLIRNQIYEEFCEIHLFENIESAKYAFWQIEGPEINEKKMQAIYRYLLKQVIALFKNGSSQKAKDLFNKLPQEIKIAVSDEFIENNGFYNDTAYIETIEQFLDKTKIKK